MSVESGTATIERFYGAFAKRDAATMAACYAQQAKFRDPVFTLQGADIGRMWKMLCSRSTDLRIESGNVVALDRGTVEGGDDTTVYDTYASADWQAWYTFTSTGRPVHNVIHAQFRLAGDAIVEHIDNFGFWRWSRQALGATGLLLGWSPMVKAKVRAQAAQALARYNG